MVKMADLKAGELKQLIIEQQVNIDFHSNKIDTHKKEHRLAVKVITQLKQELRLKQPKAKQNAAKKIRETMRKVRV